MRSCVIGTMVLLVLLAGGCATTVPMGLSGKTRVVDTSRESMVLFSLNTKNSFKPDFQPYVNIVRVSKIDTSSESGPTDFNADKPYMEYKGYDNDYLVSMNLKPGKYSLEQILGTSNSLLIHATFRVPVYTEFHVPAGKILYIGRIEAIVRPRRASSEPRAGSPVPIIDQRVAGFAGGTFDVSVSDAYQSDIKAFTSRYPVLAGKHIDRQILSAWKRRSADEIALLEEKASGSQ